VSALPAALTRYAPVRAGASAFGSGYVKLRFGVSDVEAAAEARRKVAAAMDRLEAELGGSEYLVGDTFSVADLTAASLFYPLARPPEGPQVITAAPPALVEFFDQFRDRPGTAYVTEMFARHRKPAARAVPAA
jgi:glutathione S-transferase